jgi:hypothetical protein
MWPFGSAEARKQLSQSRCFQAGVFRCSRAVRFMPLLLRYISRRRRKSLTLII